MSAPQEPRAPREGRTPRERGQVAVIGAGTMGHGIAQVAAAAGRRVLLHDADPSSLERGLAQVGANLDKGVSLGKVTPGERETVLARVGGADTLADAVREAELVIEAVPEKLELKRALFAAIEPLAPPDALLATNTSSLSIAELARDLERPANLLGLHFFNPVHIMKLVEVVHGPATSEATLEQGVSFVREIGREPIVVRDSPGFASSRLGVALGLEAIRMLEEGVASAEDIDRAMELGYRHPMGPLRLTDLVGLDVRLGISEYLHETLGGERFRPPELLRRMVAEGRLGRKTGHGFHEWNEPD